MSTAQENMFEQRYTTTQLIRDVWSFLAPYKGKVIIATCCRFLADVVWLYPTWAFASIVTFCTEYHSGESLTSLWWLFGGWFVAIFLRVFGQYLGKIQGFSAAEHASLDAQVLAMRQCCALEMSWHETENSGNKVKRIARGGEGIERLMRIWINTVIEVSVTFLGTLMVIGVTDGVLSLITGIFLCFYTGLSLRTLKNARTAAQLVNAKEEELSGVIFEGINNIRTVKVLNIIPHFLERVRILADEVFLRIQKRILQFQGRNFTLSLFSNIFRAGVLVMIAVGVMRGTYEVGFLIIFNFYFGRIIDFMGSISDTMQEAMTAKLSVARLMEVLRIPSFAEGETAIRNFPKDWRKISVQHVSFSYGNHEILHDISFDLHRGERLGIVGLSGAGKSTLFKLLLKEHENYTGDIFVDGLSLRAIKKGSYYQKAAVVLQDTEVFNLSLKENILLARVKKHDDHALAKALDVAHVTSFLPRLPQGIETVIGEKGIKLSGGERQRIGIARAVFKQPELLFLDEATSHLDLESEEKIRESLHVFFKDVTALVIAHRLTTIQEMDRILVLESGRLIEQGSFAELYRRKGRFFELWEKQKLGQNS